MPITKHDKNYSSLKTFLEPGGVAVMSIMLHMKIILKYEFPARMLMIEHSSCNYN